MKVSIALCFVICMVGVYCEEVEQLESDENNVKSCAIEHKIGIEIFDKAHENHKFPEKTPEMKLFMACVMKKEGMMTDDGKFTAQFTDPKSTEPCRNLGGEDTGEIAYNAVKCLFKHDLVTTKLN